MSTTIGDILLEASRTEIRRIRRLGHLGLARINCAHRNVESLGKEAHTDLKPVFITFHLLGGGVVVRGEKDVRLRLVICESSGKTHT
jgi:hypothetical protein